MQSRSVQCRARVCASLISVHPSVYQLGDCELQAHKMAMAIVRNLSEMPAEISISMHSKVLTVAETQVTIPPKQAHELRFATHIHTYTYVYIRAARSRSRQSKRMSFDSTLCRGASTRTIARR